MFLFPGRGFGRMAVGDGPRPDLFSARAVTPRFAASRRLMGCEATSRSPPARRTYAMSLRTIAVKKGRGRESGRAQCRRNVSRKPTVEALEGRRLLTETYEFAGVIASPGETDQFTFDALARRKVSVDLDYTPKSPPLCPPDWLRARPRLGFSHPSAFRKPAIPSATSSGVGSREVGGTDQVVFPRFRDSVGLEASARVSSASPAAGSVVSRVLTRTGPAPPATQMATSRDTAIASSTGSR